MVSARGLRTAALLPLAFLAGCGDATGPPADITGTYALMTVDGDPLPLLVRDDVLYRLDLTDGQLVLRPDSTFLLQLRTRVFRKKENTTEYVDEGAVGEIIRDGGQITLRSVIGSSYEGTVSGRTLILWLGSDRRYEFRRVSP